MPSIGEFLFGKSDKMKQVPTMNEGQQNILNQLLQSLGMMSQPGGGYNQALGVLQNYLDPNSEVYKNFEAPYMQAFEQQTIPGIAERFAGLGGGMGGGLSSSGFGQALGAAGANLQTQLAQMKSQMQRGAANDIMGNYQGMLGQALGMRPYENVYQPGSTGLIGGLASGVGQGLGTGIGLSSGQPLWKMLSGFMS